MDAVKDIDLYDLLNIPPTADESQIKKAYRKKALTCHPDKNPDNPNAALLFLELSKALEILLDRDKKGAYDKIYNAKKAAQIRHQKLDTRRKKFKEDLEIKEKLAQSLNNCSSGLSPEQSLAEEIERLRKEGSRQLKEELESLRQQIHNENLLKAENDKANDGGQYKIKIRWKSDKDDPSNGGYNTENLSKIFSKYGNIADLIVLPKKKGSGLIVFEKSDSAFKAYQLERGYPENPLQLHWLNEGKSSAHPSKDFNQANTKEPDLYKTSKCLFPSVNNTLSTSKRKISGLPTSFDNTDYEALVFAKLREAEDKKNAATRP